MKYSENKEVRLVGISYFVVLSKQPSGLFLNDLKCVMDGKEHLHQDAIATSIASFYIALCCNFMYTHVYTFICKEHILKSSTVRQSSQIYFS